ncbi:MAG: 4-hydroxy-tetrahydrodipicolinate synthase [Magnetococcales bacterium]|nr:4-hydroxy-tetrahydrodipicolinate synthase [Magnetococcales bacterium]NGZ25713.1 4-hydroxy-tetrahydrodipicolinate synthase [Magnetococcales bacterium]
MFQGVLTALVTPMHNDGLDMASFEKCLDRQLAGGVHGVVPCGTTGESATLTMEEQAQLIRQTVATCKGKVKVVAGSGTNSTAETIQLTRQAQELGADAALLITPYYNKPTPEGLFRHFQAVAQAVDLPIILYNVPGRTVTELSLDTVARLAEVPNIVGIKDASANMERISWLRKRCGKEFTLLSGDDATFLPFLSVGGDGVISVSSNLVPEKMAAIWSSWQSGQWQAALTVHEQLLEIHKLLFCETNPIPAKAAMHLMGLCGPEIRLPLVVMSDANEKLLRQALVNLSLPLG